MVGRSFDGDALGGIGDDLLRAISIERALDELIEAALVVPDEEGAALGHLPPRARPGRGLREHAVRSPARPPRPGRALPRVDAASARPRSARAPFSHAGDAGKTRVHAARAAERIGRRLREPRGHRLPRARPGDRTRADVSGRLSAKQVRGARRRLPRGAGAPERGHRTLRAGSKALAPAGVRLAAEETLREIAPIDDVEARASELCWKIARLRGTRKLGLPACASLAGQGRGRTAPGP